jgi:cation diffusion facilitator CzcD-associated flavoprotein CzcO
MTETGTVCVIGAGISGLVTAKVLTRDGFDVTVFEKAPTIGGVWAPSRTYPGLRANGSQKSFSFSDHRYPASSDKFPTADQVFSYLESYVEQFDLAPHLHCSTEVQSVRRRPAADDGAHPGFDVTVRPVDAPADAETHAFDYVVVCNGVFSNPFVPEIDGQDRFDGSLIHSSQMPEREQLRGKRVIVVGAGNSAFDCARVAAQEAQSSTLLFRRAHWMLPRYFPGDLLNYDMLLSRYVGKVSSPAYCRASALERGLRTVFAPLLRLSWHGMGWLFRRLSDMPPSMVPDRPPAYDMGGAGFGTRLYDMVRNGEARARRGEIESFAGGTTLQLDSGEEIDADLVICATGWKQDLSLLQPALRDEVQQDGKFHLYRHIVPPTEPRLGFVGYASSTNNMLTSEIAAHWLSECFLDELSLPDVATMDDAITERHEWIESLFPSREEGYYIGTYVPEYVDELVDDMGLPTCREDRIRSKYFEPFTAERYDGLGDERRRARNGRVVSPSSR